MQEILYTQALPALMDQCVKAALREIVNII